MTDERGRLRVLIVATWYPSGAAMGGTFVADQVAALRSRFDVAVIAPKIKRWRDFSMNRVRPTPWAPGDVHRPVARPWIPLMPAAGGRAYEAAVERAYRRSVQEDGQPDIIHAHVTFPGGFAAAKVGRHHGIPVVLTEHASHFATHLGSPFAEDAARWTLHHVSRVIAVGPSLRDEIIRFLPDCRVDVVGNVIDTDFFSPGDGAQTMPRISVERPLRLLTTGVSAPIKGVDVLLDAMRLLADVDVSVELVVAGDGPARADLENRSRRLGVEDRCRFVGFLSRADVRTWLNWCDLYVSASRYETYGVAIAEALSCARPVVVSKSGGPDSFVEPEFGASVEPGDPEALAAVIREIASGARRLDGYAGRRRIVDRFGWEAFLANMSHIYQDVIQ